MKFAFLVLRNFMQILGIFLGIGLIIAGGVLFADKFGPLVFMQSSALIFIFILALCLAYDEHRGF